MKRNQEILDIIKLKPHGFWVEQLIKHEDHTTELYRDIYHRYAKAVIDSSKENDNHFRNGNNKDQAIRLDDLKTDYGLYRNFTKGKS